MRLSSNSLGAGKRCFNGTFLIIGGISLLAGTGSGLLSHALALPTSAVATELARDHDPGRLIVRVQELLDARVKALLDEERKRGESRAAFIGIGVGLLVGGVILAMCLSALCKGRREEEERGDGGRTPEGAISSTTLNPTPTADGATL
jgi:hypothetical protein